MSEAGFDLQTRWLKDFKSGTEDMSELLENSRFMWVFAPAMRPTLPFAVVTASFLSLSGLQMLVSQNKGTLIQAPKHQISYHGDPQIGTPNCGKSPNEGTSGLRHQMLVFGESVAAKPVKRGLYGGYMW